LSTFLASTSNVELQHTFSIEDVNGYTLRTVSEEVLHKIRQHPDIASVEYNKKCSIVASQSDAPWNLARISSRDEDERVYRYDDKAGAGVDIYIADTGVNVKHEEFEGRARWGASFVPKEPNDDLNGHGSHVAGRFQMSIISIER
jgi:subtilisin family serine protease